MLRKRRVLTIVLVLTIVAIVGAMVLSACQIKLNNPPEDNDNVDTPNDEQGTMQEPEQDTTQHPEQDADTTPDVTPDPKPPIVEQKTEAEYKAMFEAELPRVIENYFNENLAGQEWKKVSNCKVKLFNVADGTIYFDCVQDFCNVFMSVKSPELAKCTSYEQLNITLNNCTMTTDNIIGVTVQTETLANEIAEFALEQAEVVNYLAENGIDASELKVLNATEFYGESGYLTTNITLKSENSIFSVKLAGRTGTCSSEEEYLTKFKNGYLEKVTIGETIEYKQLTVA